MTIQNWLKKINIILKNLQHRKTHLYKKAQLQASSQKNTKQPDITFYTKKHNENLYEVTNTNFSGISGKGVTPEQALSDLITKMSSKIDEIVKNTLITSIHKDEIQGKFNKLVNKYYLKSAQKEKNIFKKIYNFIFKIKPENKLLEVNISLKKSLSGETLFEQIMSKDMAQINLAKIPYPKAEASFFAPLPSPFGGLDNKLFLKKQINNEEFPIHLLLDDAGNNLDETFSFGIVVNLN